MNTDILTQVSKTISGFFNYLGKRPYIFIILFILIIILFNVKKLVKLFIIITGFLIKLGKRDNAKKPKNIIKSD